MTTSPVPVDDEHPSPSLATGADSHIDTGVVREIAGLLGASDLTEIEVQKGDLRIRVVRQPAVAATIGYAVAAPQPTVAAPSSPSPSAPAAPAPSLEGALKSPMVGTAYLRASPEAKPFVEVGSLVKPGDRLLLVEAMKTFNEVLATRGGTVTAILVTDGQPVEYDQPLMVIA